MRPSHRHCGELVQDNWANNCNSNREDAPEANRGRTSGQCGCGMSFKFLLEIRGARLGFEILN